MRRQVFEAPIMEAATKLGCQPHEVDWWSWPEVFGSTSGPRNGIGGQALTTFQVFGFEGPDGKQILCCAGIWKLWRRFPEMSWK